MGYKRRRKVFSLVFPEDHDLHGLEITAESMTLGEVRALQARADEENLTSEQFAAVELEAFVGQIKKWNLEDEDGNPLPISVESLQTLTAQDVRAVVNAYAASSLGQQVPGPLDGNSNSGNGFPEASLPMAT
jgi:hypothetical protein